MNHVEAFEHYLEIEERRSPATVRGYLADIRQLRAYLDGDEQPQHLRGRDWEQLTAADLRGFLASIRPKPHRVHRLLASWLKFWSFLRDVQHVPVGNPPGEIKRPKLPGRLPKYLETPDVAKLLQAAHSDQNPDKALRNWAFLAFLYGTGARLSEVLGLTFDRIAYADGLPVSVRVIGKGDKERTVPLSPTAQRALVQWLKVRRTEGHPTSPHVWSYLEGAQRGQHLGHVHLHQVRRVAHARVVHIHGHHWPRLAPACQRRASQQRPQQQRPLHAPATSAAYPSSTMAAIMACWLAFPSTTALPGSKDTCTFSTPGTAFSAFSTAFTQCPQLIPVTFSSVCIGPA